MRRISSGCSSPLSVYALTPTILKSPLSRRFWNENAASAISELNQPVSMPLRMPLSIVPSSDISSIWAKTASHSSSIWSVSDSTNHEPPSGSITLVTPVSSAITCWVRRATRAAWSLGSARTSSSALVCSDWVPPSTAASASIAVRVTLLTGCGAVSETPAVCVWKRISIAFSAVAP